jgi:hypothetical protein
MVSTGLLGVASGLLVWDWHVIYGLTIMSFSGLVSLYSIYRWALEPAFADEAEGHH